MLTSSLSGPVFPQMSNDNYISNVELESDNGVIIEINRYSTAETGDYINLYWDGGFVATLYIKDPDSYIWPWNFIIPISLAPDGPHQSWYTVTDIAQNLSTSSVSDATVDREHTEGLPPPTFPDAEEAQITYDSVVNNNGTHIYVPYSQDAFNVNDTVYVYWYELDSESQVVPESSCNITHIVTQNDINDGFDVLVPIPYVTAVNTKGTGQAWYSVIPRSTQAKSSKTTSVIVNMAGTSMYPAPYIPAGSDGWIDCGEIQDNGIEIDIPENSLFETNDIINIYWQGFDNNGREVSGTNFKFPHTIIQSDILNGFIVNVPVSYIIPINIGYAQSWYQNTSIISPGTSYVSQVQVDTTHCTLLPSPVFPEGESDGVISESEAIQGGGTPIYINYPAMTVGDIVTILWSGYQSEGSTPVPGSIFKTTQTITSVHVTEDSLTIIVPTQFITIIGKGYADSYYQVSPKTGGIEYSEVASVIVSTSGDVYGGSLVMGGGSGYIPLSPTTIQNQFVQYLAMDESGIPLENIEVTFTIYGGNYFSENKTNLIIITTDENGIAQANISGVDHEINTVTATTLAKGAPTYCIGFLANQTGESIVPSVISEATTDNIESSTRGFTLNINQLNGMFTLQTNNASKIFMADGRTGTEINNILIYSGRPISFYVEYQANDSTILSVLDESKVVVFCQYQF